jgi:hypothetical protein
MGMSLPILGKTPIKLVNLGTGDNGYVQANMYYQGTYTVNINIGTNVSEEGGLNLIAHEFMHVIQYFYFIMDDNEMMVESAATWAGGIASPNSNSFMRHAREYYSSPDVHIDGNRTATILFLYYLDKEHDISIKRVMEAQASIRALRH